MFFITGLTQTFISIATYSVRCAVRTLQIVPMRKSYIIHFFDVVGGFRSLMGPAHSKIKILAYRKECLGNAVAPTPYEACSNRLGPFLENIKSKKHTLERGDKGTGRQGDRDNCSPLVPLPISHKGRFFTIPLFNFDGGMHSFLV